MFLFSRGTPQWSSASTSTQSLSSSSTSTSSFANITFPNPLVVIHCSIAGLWRTSHCGRASLGGGALVRGFLFGAVTVTSFILRLFVPRVATVAVSSSFFFSVSFPMVALPLAGDC